MKETIAVLTRLNGNWRSRRQPNALIPRACLSVSPEGLDLSHAWNHACPTRGTHIAPRVGRILSHAWDFAALVRLGRRRRASGKASRQSLSPQGDPSYLLSLLGVLEFWRIGDFLNILLDS